MSMDNQRSTADRPVMVGDAVPGTTVTLPSELTHVQPTKVDEATQQGSTQPGDGAAVRVVVNSPSWKEKVIGYAKKSRGIMLRRPEVKEHGEKILECRATVSDPNQVPDRSGSL
ncbi:hypothetical protein BDM02DRAFT_2978659 [Thelephora ganbajun]|uniref:Uncharacterized protein n=1 Tax=Thelephora ganbajun TaxID=370292 RepID=A0ACB6ZC10_THEGA|nr:hypothetical protein BDM02DRAFT_2978659 [Thelephora ganbajun]